MREERKKEETKMLKTLRGYEEYKYDYDEKEENNHLDLESQEETESETPSKFTLIKKIITIIIIITFIFLFYINFISIKLLDVNEYKVESNKISDTFDGLKIVHFSDIHYGTTINEKELENIVKKINKINPDIVFFTGDLFDKNIKVNKDNIKKITNLLKQINPRLYKYAIYGNEDLSNDQFKTIMEEANFILLNNESILLYDNDTTPIVITGFNQFDNPNYTILTNFVNEVDPTNLYKIVLLHKPDDINQIINYNPDLILAGHSLGGLIKIPFIKPLFLQEGAKNYYNDYYKLNNSQLYISRGLGTSGINARFNNHPSINFYRVYKTTK